MKRSHPLRHPEVLSVGDPVSVLFVLSVVTEPLTFTTERTERTKRVEYFASDCLSASHLLVPF